MQYPFEPVVHSIETLPRVLVCDAPRASYRRRTHEIKSVVHWGQRKLLLSEIEFLTEYSADNTSLTVLYIGAAPGTHIAYLAHLFPQFQFVLVDAAPFSISACDNISLRETFMNDEICREFSSTKCLFISDIRSVDAFVASAEEVEAAVTYDMQLQQHFVEALRPAAAMLKFRLPYSSGTTRYLKGQLRYPVWGPATTTETRLIVTSPTDATAYPKRDYCHSTYNEQMFYFNTETRVHLYPQSVSGESGGDSEFNYGYDNCCTIGVDYCYDCSAERLILQRYLKKYSSCHGYSNLISMMEHISIACGKLYKHSLSHTHVRNKFEHRVYDVQNQLIYYYMTSNEEGK